MIVFAATETRVYNQRDLTFAEELARRASGALRNAELFESAGVERKRAEEAAALRERLVAIVSHDLRNPLSAITMAAHVLSGGGLSASERRLAARIQSSADRMTRMIDQILDFARIRTGQSFDLHLEAADLQRIAKEVVDELRVSRPDREIALDFRGPLDATCDADRIAQVLSNLIGNAIQYGRGGPISVTLFAATPDAIAIEVHNIGPPIPEAAQAGIFHAFRRETTEDGSASSSIGLGLFIAYEIVRAHGGSIAVRSPDRGGTTFTVVLPRKPATFGRSAVNPAPPQLY